MQSKWFRLGIIGSVTAALCCVTPLAVVTLGLLGMSAYVGWIDVVAIPAVILFGALAITAYLKREQG